MSSDSALAIEHALGLAYAYLNRRDRTVQEMRDHLLKRGIQDDVAEAAVVELCEQGYLDDGRFARLFVQDKRNLEQWGSARIRRGLIGRGIPEELVEGALVETARIDIGLAEIPRTDIRTDDTMADRATADGPGADAESGERGRALELLARRFPAGLSGRKESERALGVLLRKGYEYELATDALTEHRRRVDRAA